MSFFDTEQDQSQHFVEDSDDDEDDDDYDEENDYDDDDDITDDLDDNDDSAEDTRRGTTCKTIHFSHTATEHNMVSITWRLITNGLFFSRLLD